LLLQSLSTRISIPQESHRMVSPDFGRFFEDAFAIVLSSWQPLVDSRHAAAARIRVGNTPNMQTNPPLYRRPVAATHDR
jgi:hypothetical protein